MITVLTLPVGSVQILNHQFFFLLMGAFTMAGGPVVRVPTLDPCLEMDSTWPTDGDIHLGLGT